MPFIQQYTGLDTLSNVLLTVHCQRETAILTQIQTTALPGMSPNYRHNWIFTMHQSRLLLPDKLKCILRET